MQHTVSHHAIGLVEFTSIAKGIEVADAMTKTAAVQLLVAKSICPGKFIVMIGGDVAAVQQATAQGCQLAQHHLVDHFTIANIHPSVLPAISGVTPVENVQALGVLETFSVAACIEAADLAVKAANVALIRIHLAFGIGGKCYLVLTGDVADTHSALEAAVSCAADKGLLVHKAVIARPGKEIINSLL
ncbi:BMC domain-containing protein [Silvimonas iriomotensis]|uniref:Propanediol utilization: polyhedral bodies pduT n=1 Tax=Silvimonas iriomotensis TaxID=449662 RepID=A0ABQ2PBA2_9NEIS|nr:BMC domain-containing protein [Silvimonas iriomotensis]GGP22500.1 propanediol utilization: polyhedral bodies pduT [Silvimonas iriomotensis]